MIPSNNHENFTLTDVSRKGAKKERRSSRCSSAVAIEGFSSPTHKLPQSLVNATKLLGPLLLRPYPNIPPPFSQAKVKHNNSFTTMATTFDQPSSPYYTEHFSTGMEHRQDIGLKEPPRIKKGEVEVATEDDISFFHDFVAGGVAGSASVVVGHPFDTIKVRMQTSTGASGGIMSLATSYGGVSSLFRGMAAPLSTACVVNAIIFSSYGWSSRLFDQYSQSPATNNMHDSTIKAFTCGAFAGFVQGLVICPMEHLKCRLQVQHGKGSLDNLYKGPVQAARSIVSSHGMTGLYRGWWATAWREVPAFGAYFAIYDITKDIFNSFFSRHTGICEKEMAAQNHIYLWASSALAGGTTGAMTWAMIYPFDIIKTKIQTCPIDTPLEKRRILAVGQNIVRQEGIMALFRGLNITVIRAFPVNGIIFPVYEYCLMKMAELEY